MNCWATLLAFPGCNHGSLDFNWPDCFEVVSALGSYKLREFFGELCCRYCITFWLEPVVKKNENLRQDDEIHLCMHG